MKVTGIYVLDKTLPCCGKTYGIARITDIEGELPEELKVLVYPDGKEKIDHGGASSTGGGTLDNVGAMYVFVEDITEEDSDATFRIIPSPEDFIDPFDFEEKDFRENFIKFFFEQKAEDAHMKSTIVKLDPDENGVIDDAFIFYSLEEVAYISTDGIEKPFEFFDASKLASLKTDVAIKMIFAQTMSRAVDSFNKFNYYDKAKNIAEIISSIEYIGEQGVRGPLNLTAVEKLFSNVKDNIRVR